MRHACTLALALWLLLTAASSASAASAPSPEEALDRALAWVERHPATLADGGFLEIIEEIFMLYVLYNHAGDESARARYRAEMAQRQARIAPYNQANLESGRHVFDYTLPIDYVVTTAMLARAGLPVADYRAIIEDMRQFNRGFYPSASSQQLMFGLYLERLGYAPPVPHEEMLAQSMLYREPDTGALQGLLAGEPETDSASVQRTLYALTHEILALTDFGALPPPRFICDHAAELSRLLDSAIRWTVHHTELDLLAELIICARVLRLDVPAAPEGLATLIRHQEPDGSFGIIKLERENPYRHGVLTATAALALADRRGGSCGPAQER